MVNKIDRDGARPDWVVDEVFDLFDRLGANDEQLDFPVIFGSAMHGMAGLTSDSIEDDMSCLLQTIVDQVAAPDVDRDGPFQMQISALDYNTYLGVIGLGRVARGVAKPGSNVVVVDRKGHRRKGRILKVMGYEGLSRVEVSYASAGDIVAISGIDGISISDTLCEPSEIEALPALTVDEPTISMTFQVNTSPFAGQDVRFVTSRQIRERLHQELLHNVALRVEAAAPRAALHLLRQQRREQALHLAAESGHLAVARHLASRAAEVSARFKHGL